MRKRTPAALALAGALVLASCGDDDGDADSTTATTEAVDDDMADDEMADDEMSDDEMSDDEMSDDDMSEDDMAADDMSEADMADADGDIVEIAVERDDLTVLVAALQATGLDETLGGAGPFTVFAPTDEAFEDYFGEMGLTADDVLADPEGTAVLLQGHVVSAADDSSMVASMTDNPFVSLAGTELPVTVDGDTITIGGATIVEADVFATNGVIHVIDTVLDPS